jgi:hypothetical protein
MGGGSPPEWRLLRLLAGLRGELPLKTEGVGEAICMARISDGVRKGMRWSRVVGMKAWCLSSYWERPEMVEKLEKVETARGEGWRCVVEEEA